MDFLALAFLLGLLFLLFRQTERWLHQHIFKVGWLLSNSFPATTIVYYIIFLPGIVLHELALWLAAGVLNVRAEGSIGFPEPQEIGELRLNFVRLADGTGRVRRLIIRICPVLAGMAALWAIALHVFQWETLLALAGEGSLDGWARALASLTRTADLWLWFYLAFVVANTMFPTLAARSDKREKAIVLFTAPLLAFGLWRLARIANPASAGSIEALMGSLGLVVGQIAALNLCAVAVLGTAEALIERITNRSAAFRDGKMITMSREEAREFRLNQYRESRASQAATNKPRSAPSLSSIYDIKLPIPGPPGREPVSRSAVSVINLDSARDAPPIAAADSTEASGPVKPEPTVEPGRTAGNGEEDPSVIRPKDHEDAPFDRPFVAKVSPGSPHQDWRTETGTAGAEPFARPFVMASRGNRDEDEGTAGELTASESKAEADGPSSQKSAKPEPVKAVKRPNRTRPAPTPSQREQGVSRGAKDAEDTELEYEAFDDDRPFDDAAETYDEAR
ncbi:MAG: hypothetical protein OXG78_01005 [Chloroflexi bacterium]|nr:hypothetical protein [Chloroflexota bacterium]